MPISRYRPLAVVLLLALPTMARPGAQSRPAPTPADYGQWESLASQPRGGLSPDGRWLVYGINRSNRDNELRVVNLGGGAPKVAPFGSQPAFSADSKWLAYSVGYSEREEERLRQQKKPVHRKLGLLNLAAGDTLTLDGVESFAFNATGTHIAIRRYAPEPAPQSPPPSPAQEPATPPGSTLIVRELATGRDLTFGNVSEFTWQDAGPLLALNIGAAEKAGNGVQVWDPASATLRVLDSGAAIYTGLAWRKQSDDLLVLKGHTDERREGATHVILAWSGVSGPSPTPRGYNPASAPDFPAGMRIVSFRRPAWAEDGKSVFVGIAGWDEKLPQEKKEGTAASTDDDEASVDVWHARDTEVIPRQKVNARLDRQRNLLAVWHLEGRFVQLAKDRFEQVTPLKKQNAAVVASWAPYAMERSIGRPAADIALVDLATGARTTLVDRIDDGHLQPSPAGRYLLYFHGDHYWTIDTRTRTIANITKTVPTTFVNRESDATVRQKPPFGVGGWTKEDAAVVLYDKFDMWLVAADGTRATRLTDGAAEQVRHRYVRLNPDEETIDTAKPIPVSLFGVWTKKSGYGRIAPGSARAERLVWLDKAVGSLARAKDAETYVYSVQAFDDSPDLFAGGPDLASARQVTTTNPFQEKFAWGRSEIVEFTSDRGERLQGSLYYPANYQPGQKYPMVVYLYERLSDGLHRYVSPSEREYYNASVFTSNGYLFFQPDIVFRPREPGLSVVECVGPAVKRVIAMGVADPARVGVVGHSWGGFDTTFLATHTDLFAAAVAGAPITNLVSNYGNHHWISGIAETDHIETGQQRMEVPLYEDLPAYIRNSAVFNVHNMKTPLLIEVGDNDGTVFWHQGIELYNIARRAKKPVVLLAYAGEDHGLRKRANQIDYQRRILQWFGHYLRNEPAPRWITDGTSVLEREQELRRAKARKGS